MRGVDTAAWIEAVTGRPTDGPPDLVQELWSGYGAIERWWLDGGVEARPTPVILKRIERPRGGPDHPRGWNSSFADARKRRSYVIERAFYRDHAAAAPGARTAQLLGERETESGGMMLLEDLDAMVLPGSDFPDGGEVTEFNVVTAGSSLSQGDVEDLNDAKAPLVLNLPEGRIVVDYPNYDGGLDVPDPLEIRLTYSWRTRQPTRAVDDGLRQRSLVTVRTDRR